MHNLIIDALPFKFTQQQINESIERNGRLILEGPIQRANYKNGNGRVYPRDVLEEAMRKYQQLIDNNNAVGQLDHISEAEVKLEKASHKITKIWWEGDDVMGRIEVLTTPMGNIVTELYKCGVNVGISSRALGSVQQIGEEIRVQPGLIISAFDLVSTPSTHGAFLSRLNESINHTQEYKYTKAHSIINRILNSY